MGLFNFVRDIVDATSDAIGSVVDIVAENPVKSIAIGVATVASGGAALAFAGPIAAAVGTAGLLGAASTGTAISTLSGAALANASLATLGGGALAVGGGGMAAGTTVVAAAGAQWVRECLVRRRRSRPGPNSAKHIRPDSRARAHLFFFGARFWAESQPLTSQAWT